jgi:carbonic anhydrase/acetyltransferase-like protein (isoleucine patch superfamily)
MVNRLYRKLFKKTKTIKVSPLTKLRETGLISVGSKSIIKGLNFTFRGANKENTYLTIGNDSVVSGSFCIENDNGVITVGDRTFIGGGLFVSINNI